MLCQKITKQNRRKKQLSIFRFYFVIPCKNLILKIMISRETWYCVDLHELERPIWQQNSCKDTKKPKQSHTICIHLSWKMHISNRLWKQICHAWGNRRNMQPLSNSFHWSWCWGVRFCCMMILVWVIQVMHISEISHIYLMIGWKNENQSYIQPTSINNNSKHNSMKGSWVECYTMQM